MTQPAYRDPAEKIVDAPLGLTDEQMAQLEAEHEEVFRLKDDTGSFYWEAVFRRPNPGEYKMLRAHAHNPERKAQAQEQVGRACLVGCYFKGEGAIVVADARRLFDRLLTKRPGICDSDAFSEGMRRYISGAREADAK